MDRELIKENNIEYYNFTVDVKEADILSYNQNSDNYIIYDDNNNNFILNFTEPVNNIVNVKIIDCTISKPQYLIFDTSTSIKFNIGTATDEEAYFYENTIYPFSISIIDTWSDQKVQAFAKKYFGIVKSFNN